MLSPGQIEELQGEMLDALRAILKEGVNVEKLDAVEKLRALLWDLEEQRRRRQEGRLGQGHANPEAVDF